MMGSVGARMHIMKSLKIKNVLGPNQNHNSKSVFFSILETHMFLGYCVLH